jgi:hypothetical protein
MTVGVGHDNFVFATGPVTVGQATISGFDPHKDVITFSYPTSFNYHDDANGNALISFPHSGNMDTITLVGVRASDLHPSDFHFVDPAAAPAAAHLAANLAAAHAFLL